MMPFRVGPWEIALILAVILIVFGVGKLPQVGETMGKGLRAFKKGQEGEGPNEEEVKNSQPIKTARKRVVNRQT